MIMLVLFWVLVLVISVAIVLHSVQRLRIINKLKSDQSTEADELLRDTEKLDLDLHDYQIKRLTDAMVGWRELAKTFERQAQLADQLAQALMILADEHTLKEALAELQAARERKRRLELAEEVQLNRVLDQLLKVESSSAYNQGSTGGGA